jgi:hypothetical protein
MKSYIKTALNEKRSGWGSASFYLDIAIGARNALFVINIYQR